MSATSVNNYNSEICTYTVEFLCNPFQIVVPGDKASEKGSSCNGWITTCLVIQTRRSRDEENALGQAD